ncbi:DUF3027 domain-containing protein [Gulosibacter faecalis]|uniref:DUF3027 domain-containing protein n=1 Tax=Gulosibacter faecalis TaxID=272240 RepID=A0ABW5UU86_9MICO|nr:DUF3027 domain-containing protein [Gulosibacter faecalis]
MPEAAETTTDEGLIGLALAALAEVAPAEQIGEHLETSEPSDEGVRTLRFAANVPGHRDWFWTVWTTVVDDAEPTVLECDLLPGEDALLAPSWVPWAERLAEFRATHDRHGNLVDDEDDAEGAEFDDEDDDFDEAEHDDEDGDDESDADTDDADDESGESGESAGSEGRSGRGGRRSGRRGRGRPKSQRTQRRTRRRRR